MSGGIILLAVIQQLLGTVAVLLFLNLTSFSMLRIALSQIAIDNGSGFVEGQSGSVGEER